MNRLFTRSTTITCQSLDKIWDFCTDPDNRGNIEKWYDHFPENYMKMNVPSCWNTTLGLFRYEGIAWYRTEFETASEDVYINFESVCHECDLYVDGRHYGNHYGGQLEFGFDVPCIGAGKHEMVVRVDNTVDMAMTIPHSCSDWYNYGGICRTVSVIELGECNIRDMVIKYELNLEKKSAVVNVATTIFTKKLRIRLGLSSIMNVSMKKRLRLTECVSILRRILLWTISGFGEFISRIFTM